MELGSLRWIPTLMSSWQGSPGTETTTSTKCAILGSSPLSIGEQPFSHQGWRVWAVLQIRRYLRA